MSIKIYKILMMAFIITSLTSCEKEWLDVTSNTQVKAEDQFESEEGFKDALIGVYIGMTKPEAYGKDLTYNLVDLLSQQYATLPANGMYAQVQQFNYRGTRSTEQVDALWDSSYNIIANINIILDYMEINRNVLNDIDYDIIKGELLGLRASIHFDLLRLYGYGNLENRSVENELTIPYVTKYGKDVTPQKNYEETFALLVKDIEESLELLKMDPVFPNTSRPEDFYEVVNRDGFYDNRELRMNYYAVTALKARVNLWQGESEDLSEALDAAETVINGSFAGLISSENYPVSDDPIFYPEVLFALDIDGFEDLVNTYLDANQGVNYDALYFNPSRAETIFETDSVEIGLADVRYNTILVSQNLGLVNTKLLQTNAKIYPNKLPLIKISEMYLIAAEVYMKNGNNEKAAEYLSTLRNSRGIIGEISPMITTEALQEEILKEYRKEFLSEGQLFFFYKRTGATNILGLSDDSEMGDEEYVLPYPDSEVLVGNR